MKSLVLLTFIALSQARFNQEQLPINAIRQVQGGSPGVSDTIAGAAISDLLAGADPCAKLQRGDQILTELGEGSDAVAAAIEMIAAEKNFNPFSTDQPSICDDASLPQNLLLRGITPKIDPAIAGADIANALSAKTVSSPLQANGKSIADLLSENGFTNFTTSGAKANVNSAQSGRGDATTAAKSDPANAAGPSPPAGTAVVSAPPSAASPKTIGNGAVAAPGVSTAPLGKAVGNGTILGSATAMPADPAATCPCTCVAKNTAVAKPDKTAVAEATASTTSGMDKGKNEKNATSSTKSAATTATSKGMATGNNGAGAGAATNINGAEDFGSCDPTMSFEAGRAGRKASEFTFQSNDAVIAANQQDALNPNIITNRICDELTNICDANAAAKAICLSAKAQIQALGTRDQTTADAWNALVTKRGTGRGRRRA